MKTYNVTVLVHLNLTVTVQADNEDAALMSATGIVDSYSDGALGFIDYILVPVAGCVADVEAVDVEEAAK